MMLLVACGIDANDHVVPLAFALVPIENHEWWTWFLKYLDYSFPSFKTLNHLDGRSGDAQVVIGIKVKHSVILTIE
jgi:hypothetical protein